MKNRVKEIINDVKCSKRNGGIREGDLLHAPFNGWAVQTNLQQVVYEEDNREPIKVDER